MTRDRQRRAGGPAASSWTVTGAAVEDELAGTQLDGVPHHDAFAWFAFQPEATVYE